MLVVDDDAITRRIAKEMLARLGYDSEEVGDGEEALAALGHCQYSAVLMDCYMPKLNGFDATAMLRKREGQTRHTPVIAMTVSGSSETANVAAKSAATASSSNPSVRETLRNCSTIGRGASR